MIKSSLIIICFCALLLVYKHKQVIFKGRKSWLSTMLKVDFGNDQSCPSWHGLKLHWVQPRFLYQSSPWYYTWKNHTINTYLTLNHVLYYYSRILDKTKKPFTKRNTITFNNNLLTNSWMLVSPFCIKSVNTNVTRWKIKCNEMNKFRIECKIISQRLKKLFLLC